MAANSNNNDNGQMTEDQRVTMALALLAEQERKDAEKEAKRLERAAKKAAEGEAPNAAHTFVAQCVRAIRASEIAHKDDAEAHRAYIGQLAGFMDTAASMPNVTTATDFRVIGGLIETTMPKVPVTAATDAGA